MRRIGLSDGQPPPRGAALLLWAVATCARRLGLRRDRLLVLPARQTAAAHRSAARRALYPQNDRQRISVLERHRGGCAEGALRNALSMIVFDQRFDRLVYPREGGSAQLLFEIRSTPRTP